ncbi:MAG: DNA polymerase III subunit delta [Clostridia bacterium]|nr:DNA polymerase III subunit delta [Clostridia bacterium]
MLTIENLEKELKNGTLQSLYLLYGEEVFLLESSIKKIRSLFGEAIKGINYISIDETNYNELIADIETPSFGYEKKLIIAKNTGLFKKEGKRKNAELAHIREKINTYLKDNIEIVNTSVVLVFIEEEADTKQELYTTIDKLGVICKFDYQKPLQIEKRIQAICNGYKVTIEPATLRYFIECCGTNMQDLINEIRKLIEYVGENGNIQKEDIDQLATKKLESVIFDLTDSLGKKNIAKALEVLKNLIYAKEPLQKILITLYNHFKKLYLVKLSIRFNKNIMNSLNLKPNQTFLINKYQTQANYFSERELKDILQNLRDLDSDYKIGLIDLQIGLETILCQYCYIK